MAAACWASDIHGIYEIEQKLLKFKCLIFTGETRSQLAIECTKVVICACENTSQIKL